MQELKGWFVKEFGEEVVGVVRRDEAAIEESTKDADPAKPPKHVAETLAAATPPPPKKKRRRRKKKKGPAANRSGA